MKKSILKYKIKNRYLMYIVFFSYLSGSLLGLFIHNVSAINTTYSTGFTDGVLLNQYNNSFMETFSQNSNGKFYIYSSSHITPLSFACLYGTSNPRGYWNYNLSDKLVSWSAYIKRSGINQNILMYFNSSTGQNIIKFSLSSTTFQFYDGATSAYVDFSTCKDVWSYMYFGLYTNGSVKYQYNNTIRWGSPVVSFMGKEITNTTFINSGTPALNNGYLFDTLEIITGDYLENLGSGCNFIGKQIGDLTPYYATDITSKSLYEDYNIPITTTISGVKLSVNPSQYTDDSTLSNYVLTVNNNYIGGATCFFKDDSGYYSLGWNCNNLAIDNETVHFNFTHSVKTGSRYWIVGNGGGSVDLDGDGDFVSGRGNTGVLYSDCKWVIIGYLPFWVCTNYYGSNTNNFDLSYCFFHSGLAPTENYNYIDSLGLHKYSSKNSTGYIYDLSSFNGIICSYTLSDPTVDYTIEVYKNGVEYYKNFPFNCFYPSGTVGLMPNGIGKYVFKLKNTGYVYNITAYVTGIYPNYYISTDPVISNQYESYDVLYKYNHPQNYSGAIALFEDYTKINKFLDSDYTSDIEDNSDSSISYISSNDKSEYWRLFVNKNNSYFGVGNIATHYIRLPNVADNNLKFVPDSIGIYNNNPESRSVFLYGNHLFPGAEVFIFINGKKFVDVGGKQSFNDVSYLPPSVGIYTADLRINHNGTWVIITNSTNTLNVYSLETELPEEKPFYFIEPPFSYFAGTFIIILLTLTPIFFGFMFKMSLDKIPQFLYLVFAIIGFVASILLGFFPAWTIAVLVILTVLIIFIIWIKQKDV